MSLAVPRHMVAVSPSSTPISASMPISPARKAGALPASRLTAAVEEDTDRLAAGAAVGAVALSSGPEATASLVS